MGVCCKNLFLIKRQKHKQVSVTPGILRPNSLFSLFPLYLKNKLSSAAGLPFRAGKSSAIHSQVVFYSWK